jgi:hypothetical protein
MPYVSDKQRKFFHTKTAKKAGITSEMVHEWDQASSGKKLPPHKTNTPSHLNHPQVKPKNGQEK